MLNIVLFEPEIPTNTGNIMRTAIATNSKLHLIKPLGFSLDEKSVRRSGVNYIDKVDLTIYENMEDFYSKNEGEFYYLTRYGHKPHTTGDYKDSNKNIYFIFGKESTGIPKKYLKDNLDRCFRIPMSDNVRALNVSNSVAIVIYEALRQQNYNDLFLEEPHKNKDYITLD